MTEIASSVSEPVVIDSSDGHTTTVTMVEGSTWEATATCDMCDWEGTGWHTGLAGLARNHAEGTDGSR